jgi:hypothetical protein
VPSRKLRSQRRVVEQCSALRREVADALQQAGTGDAAAVDAVWRGEALGTLLWALELKELPPYDTPFATEEVVAVDPSGGRLRAARDIELELDAARLWHWRARTTLIQGIGGTELPEQYSTFEQLVGATAMRGYEEGVLPSPLRGDFRAFGKVYKQLSETQHAEAHSIAYERHHALAWLCGAGRSWDDVTLDT